MAHVQNGKARGRATIHHPEYAPADERRARGEPSALEEQRLTMATISGGAGFEAMCGAGALALAIIGLAGVAPRYLAGCATLAIGLGLISYGGAVTARWRQEVEHYLGKSEKLELETGVGMELLGGLVGLVLGIIGLANYVPHVMFPVAAIVFGGALLFGGAGQPVVATFARDDEPRFEHTSRLAMDTSGGVMAFVGIGAIILGLLGVIGVGSATVLSLVALLAMGAALLVSGFAEAARFAHRLGEIA